MFRLLFLLYSYVAVFLIGFVYVNWADILKKRDSVVLGVVWPVLLIVVVSKAVLRVRN